MTVNSVSARSTIAFAALLIVLWAAVTAGTASASAAQAEPLPCFSLCEPPSEIEDPPPLDPERSILVVNVGWDGPTPATSPKPSPANVSSAVSYIDAAVTPWFTDSAEFFRPWQPLAGGAYMISAPPHLSSSTHCSADERNDQDAQITRAGVAAARAHGEHPDDYSRVLVTWSSGVCGGGVTIGSEQRESGVSGVGSITHELGHTLGLGHANSITCKDGAGNIVPLSANCETVEYGDGYDAMGAGLELSYGPLEAKHLGWLPTSQFTSISAQPSFSQIVVLKPWAQLPHGLRAIRLTDGGVNYWIHYRSPVGVDAQTALGEALFFEPGIEIQRESDPVGSSNPAPQSQLLKMQSGPGKVVLPQGQLWENPLGTMRLIVNSITPAGASISIASRLVRVPNVIGLDRKAALAAINAAGLHFAGSTIKRTGDCDEANKVIGAVPAVGTGAPRGADVTVTIGEKERGLICQ